MVADEQGTPIARGEAGGGNPTTHPLEAAESFRTALARALRNVDASLVRSAVLGVAGGSALRMPEVRALFGTQWCSVGLPGAPLYLTDIEVAFAAGTCEPDGTVLVAGTGSAAGTVRNRRVVRTAGGHGWRLGDDGSGFWLGREAVRTTLHALDSCAPLGPLARSVLSSLGVDPAVTGSPDGRRTCVVQEVNRRPPVALSTLAPLVSAASQAGDPVATDIVGRAASALAETVGRLREPVDDGPLVLAGSLTGEGSPVGTALRSLLSKRFSGDVVLAGDGVGGAAWLALERLDPGLATERAHVGLTRPRSAVG
jgi:glucosamine kinase